MRFSPAAAKPGEGALRLGYNRSADGRDCNMEKRVRRVPPLNLRRTVRALALAGGWLAFAMPNPAQLPAPPKPFSPEVPQGVGACTIDRPCADVAPDIIKAALGPSPLEKNLE